MGYTMDALLLGLLFPPGELRVEVLTQFLDVFNLLSGGRMRVVLDLPLPLLNCAPLFPCLYRHQ